MQNTVLYVNTASYEQYRPKISKVNVLYIIYTRILKPMQKHLRCKKVRPSKVESYLEVNT